MAFLTGRSVRCSAKGVPPSVERRGPADIGALGWYAGRAPLQLPLLIARERALAHNIEAMQRYCDERRILLAPHGKTTMCPQLFHRQLQAGAWGLTVATAHQFRIAADSGARRIIIANQIVDAGSLAEIAMRCATDPSLRVWFFVDSVEAAAALHERAEAWPQRRVRTLIEVGYSGGRTGVRTLPAALALADAMRSMKRVCLQGIAGFEGLLSNTPGGRVEAEIFLLRLHRVGELLRERGDLPANYIVTAGGSSGFDLVAKQFAGTQACGRRVVLRSGCYVAHDHGTYACAQAARERFVPALELWSCVQSRPEPGLLYLNFGRRDAPFDAGYPLPLYVVCGNGKKRVLGGEWQVEGLNDQHARVRVPRTESAAVGDVVVSGISHPCGAFDRWKTVLVADEDDSIVGALETYF